MGTRVQVRFETESHHPAAAILFGNSHHPAVDIEDVVRDLVAKNPKVPTGVLRELLELTYPSDHGAHRQGDPVLRLDFEAEGTDAEMILHVVYGKEGMEVKAEAYIG